jgi:hypothetical protein
MKTLNDFYIMDIEMYSISCEDSEKKRAYVLECFTNNEKIQLLFNIRILNECIDIPACDSVYISYAPKNKITTIQRISRATRIDKNNPYKVANVYIWCEEYEEILETLSSIKEYDIMFKDKVKVSVVDFYNDKDEKELVIIEKDKVLLSNYIIGVKEFKTISWEEKLAMVEEYIKETGKLPAKNIGSLGSWVSTQKQNYKNKKNTIMENNVIIKEWENFVEKYSTLFMTGEEKWLEKLREVEKYIQKYNKIPSQADKETDVIILAKWICMQKIKYKKRKEIMKNEEIKIIWEDFIEKYQELFMTPNEVWLDKLRNVEEYIQKYKKLPPIRVKLGRWVSTQKKNYKSKNQIMENEEIRKLWEDFTAKYPHLF